MIALADKSSGKLFTRNPISAEQTHHHPVLKSSQIPCLSPFEWDERHAGQLPGSGLSVLSRSAIAIQPGRDKEFMWIQKKILIFLRDFSVHPN